MPTDDEKIKAWVKLLENSRPAQTGAHTVSRMIESPNQRGGMIGVRAGYQSEGPGAGMTLGMENVNGHPGIVKGADVQYKSGNHQFGVGAHDGPRGTRWALRYQGKF